MFDKQLDFTKYIIQNQISSFRTCMRGHRRGDMVEPAKPYEYYTRNKSGRRRSILSTSVKWAKVEGVEGYGVTGLYLAPARMVEGLNTCKFAGKCERGCIAYTGNLGMFHAHTLRLKTSALYHYTERYLVDLLQDLYLQCVKACIDGKQLFCRLNGTSDLPFYKVLNMDAIVEDFPGLAGFYDYTKYPRRFKKWDNYHVTYSYNEKTTRLDLTFRSVAFVVSAEDKRRLLDGFGPWFVDGDKHDIRALDRRRWVLLQAKNVTAVGRTIDPDFVAGFDEVLDVVEEYAITGVYRSTVQRLRGER